MSRYLNVGLIQSTGPIDFETSLARIRKDVRHLMGGMNRPELICGVEMACGMYWTQPRQMGDPIPGSVTDALSEIAREYEIYFVPGSMTERAVEGGESLLYNTIPIFAPDGSLIDIYRKICVYYPLESAFSRGDRYVTFRIPEKDITIGVMNCHDWCFPEVSRSLTLMGAELLLRPAVDPEGLYQTCRALAPARAFENQAYFISLNMTGEYAGCEAYGHTMVAAPDGSILYEAGANPTSLTLTLDFEAVRNARRYGTNYTDQLLRQLRIFDLAMPFAENLPAAPVFEDLPAADLTLESRAELFGENGLMTIGKNPHEKK